MSDDNCSNSDDSLDITLDIDVSKRTSDRADDNRDIFDNHNVHCIDVMGSVGSGKTSMIIEMMQRLDDDINSAVIAGDLTTRIDAERIEAIGVEVLQIQTGGMCHLDAPLIARAIDRLDLDALDLVVIENVGNLICPAAFPIGAHQRLVILSVTEGPHIVRKHPIMINQADVIAINKIDLAEAMGVSLSQLRQDIQGINPDIHVVETMARDGDGAEGVTEALDL